MSQNEEDPTAYMRVCGSYIGQDAINGNSVYVGLYVDKYSRRCRNLEFLTTLQFRTYAISVVPQQVELFLYGQEECS
jgi:hypothetical protein